MTADDTPDPNYRLEGPDDAHIADVERLEKVTQLILTHPEEK